VVGAHAAAVVGGLVGAEQDVRGGAGVGVEVVPLVGELPGRREVGGGGVGAVLDDDTAGLVGGVPGEAGAEQLAEVRPPVLGAGRRVHPGEAAAALDVRGEAGAAGVGEDVAAGGEEDDRRVRGEVGFQGGGVLGGVHGETVRVEGAQRGDGVRDGVVPVGGGAGVHEQSWGHGWAA
jgi:hypothetical protein